MKYFTLLVFIALFCFICGCGDQSTSNAPTPSATSTPTASENASDDESAVANPSESQEEFSDAAEDQKSQDPTDIEITEKMDVYDLYDIVVDIEENYVEESTELSDLRAKIGEMLADMDEAALDEDVVAEGEVVGAAKIYDINMRYMEDGSVRIYSVVEPTKQFTRNCWQFWVATVDDAYINELPLWSRENNKNWTRPRIYPDPPTTEMELNKKYIIHADVQELKPDVPYSIAIRWMLTDEVTGNNIYSDSNLRAGYWIAVSEEED